MAHILSDEDIKKALLELHGWQHHGKEIVKRVSCKDFYEAIQFVNQVALIAGDLDHHPDMHISFSTVTLTLSTHAAGGITEKDIELARRIEKIT